LAAMNGWDTVLRWLVEYMGMDKEAKDKIGWTALHFAAALGLKDTTELLIKTLNVSRNARTTKRKTAADLAQECYDYDHNHYHYFNNNDHSTRCVRSDYISFVSSSLDHVITFRRRRHYCGSNYESVISILEEN